MRKTVIGALAVVAIALTGCTTSQDNTNTQKYPQEAKDNFVDTCADQMAKSRPSTSNTQRREDCRCVVNKLEEQLPYDRKGGGDSFKDADRAIKDNQPLPGSVRDDLDKAETDCVGSR